MSLHFVALRPDLGDLQPVFDPFRYKGPVDLPGGFVLLCQELGFGHNPYLSAVALTKDENKEIHKSTVLIPHSLVALILEVPSQQNPLGFSG